jgi:hypothetical protein
LIVLAALPFSAPFAAIDAAHTFFGEAAAPDASLTPSPIKESGDADADRTTSIRQTRCAGVTICDPGWAILFEKPPGPFARSVVVPSAQRSSALRI